MPQESNRLLGVIVCVSGSRALGVRLDVGVLLENTDPFLGLRVAALEEESLESGLGSVDGHWNILKLISFLKTFRVEFNFSLSMRETRNSPVILSPGL